MNHELDLFASNFYFDVRQFESHFETKEMLARFDVRDMRTSTRGLHSESTTGIRLL